MQPVVEQMLSPLWTEKTITVIKSSNKEVYTDDAACHGIVIANFVNGAERSSNKCIKHFFAIALNMLDELMAGLRQL